MVIKLYFSNAAIRLLPQENSTIMNKDHFTIPKIILLLARWFKDLELI